MKLLRTVVAMTALTAAVSGQAMAQYGAPATQGPRIPAGGLQFSSQSQFSGSVPSGQASATPIALTLQEAIDRGIKNNLGLLVRGTIGNATRADRLRALSALLPTLNAGITQTETQIDLAVYGISVPGFPTVVGPFHYTDVRATATSYLLNFTSLRNLRSAAESARAADLSIQDGRDLVVQSVAAGYFAVLTDTGRVATARTQVETAQALYTAAHDRHAAGVSAAIDELRAQVELKAQQERLVAAQNALARDKLALGRAIGLPAGQDFNATDEAPYVPLEGLNTDDLLKRALENRADYRSAEAQVRAAEMARKAADAERYPTAYLDANYGVIGPSLNNSHGTFSVIGSVNINLFDGGRIRADQQTASAEIERRRSELADLRGRIDYDVRTSLLDLSTAADQVALARSNVDLATQTLDQARDRFASGVADNIEVVQAQEALAGANQDLINSLFAHNLAKVSLARSVGGAETSLKQFLGGTK